MSYTSRNPQHASVVLDDITSTTPSNPIANKHKIVDRDGKLYLRNSSGVERTLDSQTNYIVYDKSATGWVTSDAAKLTVTTDTTSGELPRNATSKTGIKIQSVASADSTNAYVYYDFTLDDTDLNGKVMSIKWDQKVLATAPTAGDMIVDIVAQSDRTTTLVTPFSGAIAVTSGTEQTYFLAPSVAAISLRIKALTNMADNAGIVISDVVVGPNVQVQGSAIGAWKSYTPAIAGMTTVSNLEVYYREVGSSIEVRGGFTATAITSSAVGNIPLPSGFTIAPASSGLLSTFRRNIAGRWYVDSASANTKKAGSFWAPVGYGYVGFTNDDYTTASSPVSPPFLSSCFSDGALVAFAFTVPVNELSANVTLANRAVEEYAWNAGTWDADDSITFGNGPSGAAITGSLAAQRTKYVRFNSPIQATDSLVLEYSSDRVKWMPAPCYVGYSIESYHVQNTTTYGGILVRLATPSTDLAIIFGWYASVTTGTYGSAGIEWATGSYYRVRKVSGGASVGYPISSANIVGRTDGVAPAAGMVGEVVTAGSAATVNTTTFGLNTTVTLTTGIWLVSAQCWHDSNVGTTGINSLLNIKGVTGTLATWTQLIQRSSAATEGSITFAARPVVIASGDATKTVVLQAKALGSDTDTQGYISAVRIA